MVLQVQGIIKVDAEETEKAKAVGRCPLTAVRPWCGGLAGAYRGRSPLFTQ